MLASLTQNNNIFKGTPGKSNASMNISSVQTKSFSGHAISSKKKGAIIKRLMIDTIELIT